jgi:short-subunit dehydrogenase
MPIDLRGRTILITGASSGIGAATARACAAAGMPVALAARRTEHLERVADECRALGVTAIATRCDVTDPPDCAHAVARAESELGPLHAVFANAGYGQEAPLLDMPDRDLRAMFETNLFGTLNIIRPAAAGMLERRSGHVLICSSCLGLFPTPFYSAYSATKAAQHHMGRALGLELRGRGVRCSTVHPVGTRTEFFEAMASRGTARADLSSDRFTQPPERVARAVVRCLRRPRPEVWTAPLARYGMILAALTPRLTDAALAPVIRRRFGR